MIREVVVVDRLPMLRQLISQRPEDPFPRYGLAMELKKQGRLGEANVAFGELIERHPTYIPAYLMAGNALSEAGDDGAARALLGRGVAAAKAAGDDHAQGELEAALAALS